MVVIFHLNQTLFTTAGKKQKKTKPISFFLASFRTLTSLRPAVVLRNAQNAIFI